MKRIYIVLTSFFSLVIVFTLAFYINFVRSNQSGGVESKIEVGKNYEETDDSTAAVKQNSSKITYMTKLIEQVYDVANQSTKVNEAKVPTSYIGLTLEELKHQIKEYNNEIPTEEKEKGLENVSLISFDENEITIRRTYDSNKAEYMFFVSVDQGNIVVYYKDRTTVFDRTDIPYTKLPYEQQQTLLHGIYVNSVEELYSMLESYSS